MADAVRIFPPGFQITDDSDNPVSGAVLTFFDTGTSNARTVYSDPGLTSSLGTSVTCNSAGRPANGGSEVLIYASEGDLTVTAKTSAAVQIWSFDNVIGALDTTTFSTNTALPNMPVLAKTGNYTVTTADVGSMINVNSTSDLTMTLPSAVTAGDGFMIGFRNVNTGRVTIDANGSQTIDGELTVNLTNTYEGVVLVSDAANWHVISHTVPFKTNQLPVLTIRDKDYLTPPATEGDPGDRYLMLATGAGDWSTFAENSVVEKDGQGAWIDYVPVAGWLAYVQDEDCYYRYDGSEWNKAFGKVFLTKGSAATDTDVKIDLTGYDTFRGLEIEIYGVKPSAEGPQPFNMQVATDTAGVTFATSGQYKSVIEDRQIAGGATVTDGGRHKINIGGPNGFAAGDIVGADFSIKIMDHSRGSQMPRVNWRGGYWMQTTSEGGKIEGTSHVGGQNDTNTKVSAVRFYFATDGSGAHQPETILTDMNWVVYGLA